MRNDSPSSLEGLNFGFAEEIHTHPPDTDTSYTDTNTEELPFLGSYTADNDTVFLQEAVPSYDENTEHSLSINEQNIPSELSSRQPLTGDFTGFDKAFFSRNPVTNYSPEEIAFAKSIYNTSASDYSGHALRLNDIRDALVEMFAQPPVRLTIWIFLSVLLTLVPTIFGELWAVVVFCFQTVPGLLLYRYGQKAERPVVFNVFLFIMSAVCLTLVLLRFTEPALLGKVTYRWWQLSLIGIIDSVCLCVMIISHTRSRQKKNACSESVAALCFDLLPKKIHSRYNPRTLYCPIYEYTYQGRLYRVHSTHYSGMGVPKIGRQYILKINPYEPSTFYDTAQERTRLSVITIICLAVIFYGFFMCYQLLAPAL